MHYPAFDRHARIALQVSGGKDSLACLHLMSEHLDRLTVYWLDTGDSFPEVREVIDRVAAAVPRFARIPSSASMVHLSYGIPTDLLPASCSPMGLDATGRGRLMQDRYSCCLRTVMIPMHQRMVDDGITLIVRGQKTADANKSPLRSGDAENGIEYLFPIEGWDDAQVMDYLRTHEIAYPRFYDEGLSTAPDCMTCSGWWEEGRAGYLRKHHPVHFAKYQSKLDTIREATAAHIAQFNREASYG